MMRRVRGLDAKKRMEDRWRRQDDAARLRDLVPGVTSLQIVVAEHVAGDRLPPISHIRRVVVDSAPALFEIPCSERDCTGGFYDVTADVLRGLEAGKTRFEGSQTCNGKVGEEPCKNRADFSAVAGYLRRGSESSVG